MHLADYLYVADSGNRRVQIFTRDGILVGKIADAPNSQTRRLQRPVAVVTNTARDIYVADAESKAIQVFSPAREWKQALGAGRYETIQGLSVDGEGRVYVLASTERAKQLVDVYNGTELEFSFAAYRAPKVEATREATLSIPLGGYDITVHDAGRKQLALYHYLQSPQRVAGVEVVGDPARVRVAWRKSPERYVAAYRVYGAVERSGAYERIAETKETEAVFKLTDKPHAHFKVSAVTSLEVEGEASAPVEDLFRAAYRQFELKQFDAALAGFERAAKSAPGHAAYVEYLGRSLLALGRNDAAIVQFQALGRRTGLEKQGMLLEAQALSASGDLLAARTVIERAISAKHADTSTYTLCADLSLQLRDPPGAVRCADIALAGDPSNPHARAMRGEALVRLGTVEKGLAELDAANAAAPADADLWRRSARVLQGLGRNKEALQRYGKLLELAPRDAGRAARQRGDPSRAERARSGAHRRPVAHRQRGAGKPRPVHPRPHRAQAGEARGSGHRLRARHPARRQAGRGVGRARGGLSRAEGRTQGARCAGSRGRPAGRPGLGLPPPRRARGARRPPRRGAAAASSAPSRSSPAMRTCAWRTPARSPSSSAGTTPPTRRARRSASRRRTSRRWFSAPKRPTARARTATRSRR